MQTAWSFDVSSRFWYSCAQKRLTFLSLFCGISHIYVEKYVFEFSIVLLCRIFPRKTTALLIWQNTRGHCASDVFVIYIALRRVFSSGITLCMWHQAGLLRSCVWYGNGKYINVNNKRKRRQNRRLATSKFLQKTYTKRVFFHPMSRFFTNREFPRRKRLSSGNSPLQKAKANRRHLSTR